MKKLFVTLAITSITAGAFAQATLGRVAYVNQSGTTKKAIYNVDKTNPLDQSLNIANRDLIAKGTATTYTVELWYGSSEASLAAAAGSQISDWAAAGVFKGNANFDIQGTKGGDTVALQVRAWDNRGGTIKTWADVLAHPDVARGASAVISGISLGGIDADGGVHSPVTILNGMQSFGLYTLVPEPSIIALGALGLGALVLRRRK